ncbi:MAG: ABC transporter permease [Candidatus Woesearchaeota archaeon]
MYRLIRLIKKNFKLLLRTKSSLVLIICSPLLLVLLGGIAFNNASLHEVHISVFGDVLGNLDPYVVHESSSLSECQDTVKYQDAVLCLAFQNDSAIDIYVDQSQYNLAYMVLKDISKSIDMERSSLSSDLAQALFDQINSTRSEIQQDQELVTRLTKSHKEKEDNLDSLTSGLKTTSPTIPNATYNSLILDLETQVKDFKTQVTYHLHKARNEIEGINGSANATSQLNDAIDLVDQLSVSGNIRQLENALSDIQDSLETLSSQIESSNEEIAEALESSASLQESLDEDLKILLDLQESFDRIADQKTDFTADDVADPIKTTISPVSTHKTHFNYLFSGILVLFIMFVGVLLAATLVIMEKTSKAFIRNVLTPTRNSVFILAGFLTTLLLLTFQIILLLAVSAFFIPVGLAIQLFAILLLISTVFILIGMALGYMFKSHESAILASIGLCALFLIFSGMLIPLESMPSLVSSLAQYNPFVLGESMVKMILLYQPHFLTDSVILLASYSVLLFLALIAFHHKIRFNLGKKHGKRD